MTAAVVFASKYGTTGNIARHIAKQLGPDTAVFDLADGEPDLTGHDLVVLGTAVYMGQPMSSMKTFARSAVLDTKQVGLFVSGMETDPDKRDAETKAAFPSELADRAVAVGFLGGRFLFGRMSMTDKFVIRRVTKTKTKTDVDAVDREAVDRFVSQLRDHPAEPTTQDET